GLRTLAEQVGAEVIVFCSDSHTAKGHVAIGNSAERLLEGGSTAIAIAPVDIGERVPAIRQIVAIGDGDGGARETAEALPRGARPCHRSPTATPTCSWSTPAPMPTRGGSRSAPAQRT